MIFVSTCVTKWKTLLMLSGPIDHVSIGHHQSQRPVPRDFPLFKRCE